MNRDRFEQIIQAYPKLRVAVCGDFCLDRYWEIDSAREETSIETGLAVHNIARVRTQPGGAGTILNNLVAAGAGRVHALGFAGEDGEGYDLKRALASCSAVNLELFLTTPARRTFTYTKPLRCASGNPPVELNRLDLKNWSPTPDEVSEHFRQALQTRAGDWDAIIFLEQVDLAETGVLTSRVLEAIPEIAKSHPRTLLLGDSRRGLNHFPPMMFKMNRDELGRLTGHRDLDALDKVRIQAAELARRTGHPVFVTLSEGGILGADRAGETWHRPALPIRGPIDIVGAGDAVTAHLVCSLTAGATISEAIEIAMAAASVVVHQVGTTGTATPGDLRPLLFPTMAD
ncbi:MAG TPA: PfkB family carbohydrate kinase [Candidatus Paceibacterota bacterium]|nr:PfkB family carbohydrate kinase [Verrucomicrobiota bacterium]HRY51466.1 PfkB family carbohydrate kinase [Candidatus Paceibacterota bacterium]HRZ99337.1 PfkB family carbohydrate kinase [Candidatus Paceibacterota bacterium]